jgi:hypothetical protein
MMLDGKRYFAAFPDEEEGSSERLLNIAQRLQKLAALEQELRRILAQALRRRPINAP